MIKSEFLSGLSVLHNSIFSGFLFIVRSWHESKPLTGFLKAMFCVFSCSKKRGEWGEGATDKTGFEISVLINAKIFAF